MWRPEIHKRSEQDEFADLRVEEASNVKLMGVPGIFCQCTNHGSFYLGWLWSFRTDNRCTQGIPAPVFCVRKQEVWKNLIWAPVDMIPILWFGFRPAQTQSSLVCFGRRDQYLVTLSTNLPPPPLVWWTILWPSSTAALSPRFKTALPPAPPFVFCRKIQFSRFHIVIPRTISFAFNFFTIELFCFLPGRVGKQQNKFTSEWMGELSKGVSRLLLLFWLWAIRIENHFENGRRYHGFRSGSYMYPNDEVRESTATWLIHANPNQAEQDRLDMFHKLFLVLRKEELHRAPIIRNYSQTRILDLGTGTGIWAMDMAE